MMPVGALLQLVQILMALALAPLLTGWVMQCRAWLQNRTAPPLLLPYRQLAKLFDKQAVLVHDASTLFRAVPYLLFASMTLACAIVPTLSTDLPFELAADSIALVGIFALARVFLALAGMDVGTGFGSLGSRRAMLIGFLAEPALLMVLFTASLICQSTSLVTIAETFARGPYAIYPSMLFAAVAFGIVALAENGRVPVDDPCAQAELSMNHQAVALEYSGRHLALVEWAAALKLYAYSCIGLALFLPQGMPEGTSLPNLAVGLAALGLKLTGGGFILALIETANAKKRLFRAPEVLGTAFLLGVLGLLVHLLLEIGL
jgi:formate hydrogenlyase subunit 4